uniref:Acyl-CoA dehydrogenase very long chain n=1 Tax=Homo sapiens TaxID=9606 RepID=J9JID6_HUMAN
MQAARMAASLGRQLLRLGGGRSVCDKRDGGQRPWAPGRH